jgi:hypothetical protein
VGVFVRIEKTRSKRKARKKNRSMGASGSRGWCDVSTPAQIKELLANTIAGFVAVVHGVIAFFLAPIGVPTASAVSACGK